MMQSGIKNLRLNIVILIIGFTSLSGLSQSLKIINLKEIDQRKVRQYIISRSIDTMQDFSSIHASCKKDITETDFKFNEKIFYLKYNLSKVWECYSIGNPLKVWNGPCIGLGLLITKCSKSVIYAKTPRFPDIDTGQVYILNLRLMKGLVNLPVAFEVINIDRLRHLLEISYLNDNKSRGKQTIQFFDNGDGRTRIIHRSYFRSESWLRDDLLYPFFHRKFIKEFHRNMSQMIKSTRSAAMPEATCQ